MAKAKGSPTRRLVLFRLEDPQPLLYHNEPIIMNEEVVGYLYSGMYGHSVGSAIGMGYVNAPNLNADVISDAEFECGIGNLKWGIGDVIISKRLNPIRTGLLQDF